MPRVRIALPSRDRPTTSLVSRPRLGGVRVVAASSRSGEDCRFFGMYASDCQFVVDASWVDASGAVAQHVVIEPTGAQSSAGKTQPGTCEPTGGNLAGIQRPVAKKSLAIRPSPAKIPPITV